MKCLICGNENGTILCGSCESPENIEIVLNELLKYKSCESENELLRNYVLSFGNRSEAADEILQICSRYSMSSIDFTYYIASAYNNKGANFRKEFIEFGMKYMNKPNKGKLVTENLLRDISKAYAAEYEFYKAIEICDILSGPDYEAPTANLLRADYLCKIRKLDEAIELLEASYEDLKEKQSVNFCINEEENIENEKCIKLYEKALEEYREKQNKGYIYEPATQIGREKLKKLLIDEGRYNDDESYTVQTEANFDSFVCFDFETTGFSPQNNNIIEIGAVKVQNGEIIEYFSELVNPKGHISEKIIEITGITNEMVKDSETIYEVLPRFLGFISDSILVAHNAKFDCKFLLRNMRKLGRELKNPVFDTLEFSRKSLPRLSSHKLEYLTKHFGIEQNQAHRAYCDAEATAKLYFKLKSL